MADLIEVFKIMKGLEGLKIEDFFELEKNRSSHHTRGHTLKIYKQHARLDCRKYVFSQRVVDAWNSLPEEAVSSETVNALKGQIEPLVKEIGGYT